MSVVIRDKITIEYSGQSYTSLYEVTDKGIVTVTDPDLGTKKARLGDLSPDEVATLLLTELVIKLSLIHI